MQPRLVAISGPLAGKIFPLQGSPLTLGRSRSCWLTVPTNLVSRTHCQLAPDEDGNWTVRDLDSHNGTRVNQEAINQAVLRHGDHLQIGDSMFTFLSRDEATHSFGGSGSGSFQTQTIVTLQPSDCVYLRPDDSSNQAARQLKGLLAISAAIHGLRNQDAIGEELAARIFDITPAERFTVLWRDSEPGECESIIRVQRKKNEQFLQPSTTVIERVLASGEAVLSSEISGETQLWEAKSLSGHSVRSVLAVPLGVPGQLRGVLYLDTSDPAQPFETDHLQLVTAIGMMASAALQNAMHTRWLETENRRLRSESGLEHEMVGESSPMQEVYEKLARVAQTDTTVLILGESGTGKELAARAIHRNGPRQERPFVALNCAAIPEALIESELFGHEKGAFTGAVALKKGKIETAEGGTLFLDEIGEMPLHMQAKLLRVIQEREYERIGGNRTLRADIRVIAATNRALEDAIASGSFRQDLFYRLNVVSIALPPLRQRREDIPLLSGHFLALYSDKCKRKVYGISAAARHCLASYDWPGNVRELQNVIERAVVLGATGTIELEDLPEELHISAPETEEKLPRYLDAVREVKKAQILQAVQEAGGNITAAAKLLGVHPNYLHRLIRNLGLRQAMKKTG
ncbi:MAG: FHA domain-containing protein [Acidimicrobiia bacterium]|nr:FHA domain-containing protein [Acidimicrobiia bacterium]